MSEPPIRVLIVAEDNLARTGLSGVLGGQAGVLVVGQSAVQGELELMLEASRPDILVWDLGWSADASLEVLAEHAADFPPVVALMPGPEHAAEARRAGARGLVARDADADTIAIAVRAVWRGLRVIDPVLEVHQPSGDDRPIPAPLEPLTGRELEVLRLVAEGLPNKAIAARLEVSDHTVKFHLNAVLRKLGAQSRTDAVVRATRLGLILL
jgi:DNA-binding NarL/FixJ family response regulator